MLEKKFTLSFFIAYLLTSTSLRAADESVIIVTADRIKSSLDKSPSDIKVFEAKEIEKSTSFSELLSRESDLKLTTSGPTGSNTSLFLRGSDSSHVLVIIDGIVMNDPSNPNRQFDLGRLSLNNVERIEILKGSQGLLYGSNAIGGVILITTKKAEDKPSGSLDADYGSFDTFNAALNIQQKFNSTSLSFGADHLKTRGFSAANINQNPNADDDGETRNTLSAAIAQAISSSGELTLHYRYVHDLVELDKGGGAGKDDPNDSQFSEQQYLKAGYTHNWTESETTFAFTRSQHHRTLNIVADAVNSEQSNVTTKGEINSASINHTQYVNNYLTQNINLDYSHEEDQLKNFNENLSLFFYNRLEHNTNIFNLGLRLDHNKYFGEQLTYKVALLHHLAHAIFKTSYSTGFRAPSLNQLYDPTYGNKNLNPEESQTAEAGIEVPLSEKYKYLGTIFYTDLYNRLSYDPVTFINQNRGRARILGWENVINSKITDDLSTDLAVTWLSARDTTANQKLARRPNLNAKFSVSYQQTTQTLRLEGDYTGRRPDVDNLGNQVSMPSYMIFNLNYDLVVSRRLSTYVKVKNLLDKDYEEIFGYGTGGRTMTAGLKYLF